MEEDKMQWYAVYTKPNREEMVAGFLKNAGLEVFNPKLKQRKYLQGVYRDIISPLFPSYIFVRFEPMITSWMRYTRGVRKIVGGDSPWPVSNEIIDLIKSNEENGFISIKPHELRCGDKVAIKDGPLQGFKGIFEKEVNGQERVILLLTAIKYQARIIIEKSLLIKDVADSNVLKAA